MVSIEHWMRKEVEKEVQTVWHKSDPINPIERRTGVPVSVRFTDITKLEDGLAKRNTIVSDNFIVNSCAGTGRHVGASPADRWGRITIGNTNNLSQ